MTAISLVPPPGVMPPPGAAQLADHQPVAVELAAPTAAPAPTPTVSSIRLDASVRVLLVEELVEVATHINELLREDEHVKLVETVSEGSDAMGRIVALNPDVVVIDALLQGKVSGLQVAREMRAKGMDTPIVFMTVPDRPVTLTVETGIAEVVTLPLDAEKLRRSIVHVDDAHRGPVLLPPSGTIAVFSGKGGVGRTTIAHNLAVAMNQRPATSAVRLRRCCSCPLVTSRTPTWSRYCGRIHRVSTSCSPRLGWSRPTSSCAATSKMPS